MSRIKLKMTTVTKMFAAAALSATQNEKYPNPFAPTYECIIEIYFQLIVSLRLRLLKIIIRFPKIHISIRRRGANRDNNDAPPQHIHSFK